MRYTKDIQIGKTAIRLVAALFFCLWGVFGTGVDAKAAKTCSSVISLPAKTNSKVNMRKKAGTGYASYGYVGKNKEVTVLGQVTNAGVKWYKCKAKVNGKSKTGYICASYVNVTYPQSGKVNSKVTSTLNVRKKMSQTSKSLTKLKKDAEVTVKGMKKKSGTYWYKISTKVNGKTVTGYVSGKYITSDKESGSTKETDSKEEQTGYVNDKVTTTVRVRKSASTSSDVLMNIPKNTKVTILGTSGSWYKIKVSYGGKTVTGYIAKEYITVGTPPAEKKEEETPVVSEAEYGELLAQFPESYKAALNALHSQYPGWKFVAVNTNLDWNSVIVNESVVGRNVIQSNYPKGTASLAPFSYLSTVSGAYDWSTDSYVVKDGSNWYCANQAVVSYYMDPRNFLNSTDIFQFEALAYDASQSADVVQSILSNTFMKGSYSVKDSATGKTAAGAYKDAFMDAGKTAKANPYFLATRVKQEVGTNGSLATSGTYKGYEGIYNFYNIGANDGQNAVANGLNWAKGGSTKATTYGRPWTTPYKSIVGGAQYIAANYINKGQDTLYFQKFNVKPTDNNQLYLHQYMTNVQAPYSEGKITRAAYNSLGILNSAMVFYIPVYNNMPAIACALPAAAGNPNPYLKSLSVQSGGADINLDSTFVKPSATGELSRNTYSVVVGKSVSAVTVKANAISGKAAVSGTGNVNLKEPGQTTTVVVTCTAQSGARQEYVINIVRNTK